VHLDRRTTAEAQLVKSCRRQKSDDRVRFERPTTVWNTGDQKKNTDDIFAKWSRLGVRRLDVIKFKVISCLVYQQYRLCAIEIESRPELQC